jgi:glycerol uptake facilitator-like aquaporin
MSNINKNNHYFLSNYNNEQNRYSFDSGSYSDDESIKNAYGDLNSPIFKDMRSLVTSSNKFKKSNHASKIVNDDDSYLKDSDQKSANLSFISKHIQDKFEMNDFERHSDLDNILIDDEYKNIPMLGNKFENYAFSESDEPLITDGGEITYNKKTIKKYYLLEFVGAFTFSALITNNVIFISQFEMSDFCRYVSSIIFNNLSLLAILYALTNVSTYRSMNITLGYLILNAGIFNYNLSTIISYLLIDIAGGFLGSLSMMSIYHEYITEAQIRNILISLTPQTQDPYTKTADYVIISGIVFIIFLLINVVVISYDTSINCKATVVKKVLVAFLINLLFMHHTSGINNSWVSYGFRFSYCLWTQSLDIFRTPRLLVAIINLVVWVCISPIIVKYFNGKFKTWYARYIEYN